MNSVLPIIESKFSHFTKQERKIAEYFMNNNGLQTKDFSNKAVSARLGVSEAALTRFAKKCDFRGFREFSYAYCQPKPEMVSDFTEPVLSSYQELLNKTYALIDVAKIENITKLLVKSKNIFIYGKGSSGNVAKEIKFRFMRLGLVCEAVTDNDIIRMNEVVVNKDSLVIGISISGHTRVVIEGLMAAKRQKAKTVLLTANNAPYFTENFDIVQLFAMKNQLECGQIISPQFPILVILDILYANLLNKNSSKYNETWQRTYNALQLNKENLNNINL